MSKPGFIVNIPADGYKRGPYLLPCLKWVTPTISGWEVAKPSSATAVLDKWLPMVGLVECGHERGRSSQKEHERS